MNNHPVVHAAMQCLKTLETGPADVRAISAESHVVLAECQRLLSRLHAAGLITRDTEGRFGLRLPLEELSILDILDAIWESWAEPTAQTALYGSPIDVAPFESGDARLN